MSLWVYTFHVFCQMHNVTEPPLHNWWESFTALRVICALPVCPSFLLATFLCVCVCLHSFALSRILYFGIIYMHIIWSLLVSISYLVICISGFSMPFYGFTIHLFLVLKTIPLSRWNSLFIHLPTEGHFGCLKVLTVMTKDAINLYVQAFICTRVLNSST